MRIYRTCNCLQNHQLHLLLLLFPTFFPQTKTTKKPPTAGHQQPSILPSAEKNRPETAPEVLFALHDPRSSGGGGKIKQSQLQRRENTEVCDVWLFDGKKNDRNSLFVVGSPLKDRKHVCHVVFENIWWQIMRRNTVKNGKLLTKWLLLIGLDLHQ